MLHVMSDERTNKDRKADIYRHIVETDMDSSMAMRTLRKELPWKDWLLVDFLRYWYLIGVLVLEGFVLLSVAFAYNVDDGLGIFLLLLLAVAILYLAYRGYVFLWPEGGLTRLDRQKVKTRRAMGRRRRFD